MPKPEEDTIITVLVFLDPQKKSAAQPATPYSAQDTTTSLKNAAVIGRNGIMAYGKDEPTPAGIIQNPIPAIPDASFIFGTGKKIANVRRSGMTGDTRGGCQNPMSFTVHAGMMTAQTETLV
jgi:hypothetical protein